MVFDEKRKAAIYFFATFDVWKVIHLIMPSAYLKELSHEIVKKKKPTKTDRSRPKEGRRQVFKYFRVSFSFILKL